MSLRVLPTRKNLSGLRVLVRVDWNIPLDGGLELESSLKIERSLAGLRDLSQRGAVVIVMTHLGRPQAVDPALSTVRLVPLLKKHSGLALTFHPGQVSDGATRRELLKKLTAARPGSIHLLENVRFEVGEEKNSASLSKAYASLGDLFVNDAFASCHRAHASIVGLAKQLPIFAGPALVQEVRALSMLLKKPRAGFIAVIGGKKLSTKLPVVIELLQKCETIMLGGAMIHPCFVAQGRSVGRSYVEPDTLADARALLQEPNLLLPQDVMVAPEVKTGAKLKCVAADQVGDDDIVVDIGHATLKDWSEQLQSAKTILWNGPLGITEIPSMAYGSHELARFMSTLSRTFTVAGGGDTLPIILATRTQAGFDFISTGGGAMLEFLVKRGHLPGLAPLVK